MAEENSESTITTPLGSVSVKGKRMAEIISVICLCLLFLLGYILWEHKEDSKGMKDAFANGFTEMAKAQREQNQIQREQLCLLAMPETKREREFLNEGSFCKRLARER